MRPENKESLINFFKVLALFIVGFLGVIVSAKLLNSGGFFLFGGIFNICVVAWADYSLYKVLFKKNK